MKKIALSILFGGISLMATAQDLIHKIPSSASMVLAIKGKNITDLVAIDDFEQTKMGEMILKTLKRESDGKIEHYSDVGLDLENNFYYFMDIVEGKVVHYVTLPITDANKITDLVNPYDKEKIVQEGNTLYFQQGDGSVMLWTPKMLVFVFSEVEHDDSLDYYYNDYGYNSPVEDNSEVVIEEVEVEEAEEAMDATIVEDAVEEEESTYDTYNYYDSPEYKQQQKEREERYKKQQERREQLAQEHKEFILAQALQLADDTYPKRSIVTNSTYVKDVLNGKDEATFWVNDFGTMYSSLMSSYYSRLTANPMEALFDPEAIYNGTSFVAKLNFEDTEASISTSMRLNPKLAELTKQMYNGKVNKDFFKYFNEDNMLGYWSINMSTAGTLKAYPKLMDLVAESLSETKDYEKMKDVFPVITQLASIILDEDGIAELLRGDMLFVVTGLGEKEVSYTTYSYDDNYNRSEVTKTKTELMPDFLFVCTSEKSDFFKKLLKIGINENEIVVEDGLYKVKTRRNSPVEVYITFKGNEAIIGSSKEHLKGIMAGTYKGNVSGFHKKTIGRNTTAFYVNTKNIVSTIPLEEYPRDLREHIGFLTDQTEDMLFTSGQIKGNKIEGSLTISTGKGEYANSLDYFITLFSTIID